MWNFKERMRCIGEANERDVITIQQLSIRLGIDEKKVRKHIKWGVKSLQLSRELDGDTFIRHHRMRKLHNDYTYWRENEEGLAL